MTEKNFKIINYSKYGKYWGLDKKVSFLNHGSFGACPLPVLEKQNLYRKRLESEPLRFFLRECGEMLASSKHKLSEFINADSDDVVFVSNATSGVNTVLKSIDFREGSEILITNQIYNACRNSLNEIAYEKKLRIREVKISLPVFDSGNISDKILNSVNAKTAMVLLDHVSSVPGIVFPVEEICSELGRRGIDLLVDGAHAPGMIPLDIEKINAAYYTGNCHKWICGPKGGAFLHVRKDRQKKIKPLVRSRISGECETSLSPFQYDFSWHGTYDPTPFICIGDALDFMGSIFRDGWNGLMSYNHQLAVKAGKKICDEFDIGYPYSEDLTGSLYGIPFFMERENPLITVNSRSPLQDYLYSEFNIEVMIVYWDNVPKRILRISPQAYNTMEQYDYLIYALKKVRKKFGY